MLLQKPFSRLMSKSRVYLPGPLNIKEAKELVDTPTMSLGLLKAMKIITQLKCLPAMERLNKWFLFLNKSAGLVTKTLPKMQKQSLKEARDLEKLKKACCLGRCIELCLV